VTSAVASGPEVAVFVASVGRLAEVVLVLFRDASVGLLIVRRLLENSVDRIGQVALKTGFEPLTPGLVGWSVGF
jgi:predicted amino acid dehydrogenase